jgi:hypothetical protein
MPRLILPLLLAFNVFAADQPVATPKIGPEHVARLAVRIASNGHGFLRATSSYDGIGVSVVDEAHGVRVSAAAPVPVPSILVDFFAIGDAYFLTYAAVHTIYVVRVDVDGGAIHFGQPVAVSGAWSAAACRSRGGDRALIVTNEGRIVVLDQNGMVVGGTEVEDAIMPATAANDDGFLVAWLSTSSNVRASFTTNGSSATKAVDVGAGHPPGDIEDRPGVASDGASFLVAWALGSEIRASVVARDGSSAAQARTIASAAFIHGARVFWDGVDYGVLYTVRRALLGPSQVFLQRVMRDGSLLGEPIAISSSEVESVNPVAATANGSTLVSWIESASCSSPSFDADQVLINGADVRPIAVDRPLAPGDQAEASAVAIGDKVVVAFTEATDRRRLRVDGNTVDGVSQSAPAIATNGDVIMTTWIDRRASDCAPIVVAATASASIVLSDDVDASATPTIAWSGSEFVVVWARRNDHALMAKRVGANATPVDIDVQLIAPGEEPQPYVIFDNAHPRLIASNGELVLVWNHSHSVYIPLYPNPTPGKFEIRALRLSRTLGVLSSQRVIAANATSPGVATNGRELLILWHDRDGVHATRLSSSLQPLGESLIASGAPYGPLPSISWSGDHHLAAIGDLIESIGIDGRATLLQTLPSPVAESIVVGDTVIYGTGQPRRLFARVITTAPRRRSVSR